jgi:hypothetical protein
MELESHIKVDVRDLDGWDDRFEEFLDIL